MVKILRFGFRQFFEAEVLAVFEILMLDLVKILKFKFSQNADVWLRL